MNVQPIRTPKTSIEEGGQELIVLLPGVVRFPGNPNFNAKAYFKEAPLQPDADVRKLLPIKEASVAQTIGLLQMRTCGAEDMQRGARETLAKAYSDNVLSWGAIAYLQQQNPRGLPTDFWAQVQIDGTKTVVCVKYGLVKRQGINQAIPQGAIFAVPIP